jgi:dipeptidyl aminopeptidase/acylaminoacyl peptidase
MKGSPGNGRAPEHSLDRYLAIRRTGDLAISPDGKEIAFVSNIAGSYNLWSVPVQGGWPTQLSVENRFLHAPRWVKGRGILISQDFEGNENHQLKLIPPGGGLAEDLTSEPEVQHFCGRVSPDHRRVVYTCNRRDRAMFDTFVYDFETGESREVFRREMMGDDYPLGWSPDGRRVVVIRHHTNLRMQLFVIDVETDAATEVLGGRDDTQFVDARFLPDNETLIVLTDYDRDFKALLAVDLRTGEHRPLVAPAHDIVSFAVRRDGRLLAYTCNVNGNVRLRLRYLGSGREFRFRARQGIYGPPEFSPNGKWLAYTYQGPRRPSDVYVYDLASGVERQVTFSLVGGFRESDFCAPRSIRYRSRDGLLIHGLFYLPKGASKENPAPLILYPHGGPNHQNYNRFNVWFQYLLSRGFAIIAPDFRGSTGYGKRFMAMIYKDWGGGDLEDMLAAVDYACGTGLVDRRRVGVLGMSYGGFATLTCLTRAPEVFAAGVDIFGPANLLTFVESNPPSWRESVYPFVGHPVHDRELLIERSPLTHVGNIRAPLLVIQGQNDPRVVPAESEQIVAALRERGQPVEYILFPDEGHGFSQRKNEFTALRASADFLAKYLL